MLARVLVVGGAGALGVPVVRRLAADGYPVRVLARDVARARTQLGSGVEVVAGDVEDAGSVEAAVDGCGAVHVSLAGGSDLDRIERVEHHGTARVAKAAARAGVGCLTYLSGMYVGTELPTSAPAEQSKWRAEEAIRASGVPYVIFRPTYFLETLGRHLQGRRAVVIGRQPHPLHMVAADDFAAMVSRAFVTTAAHGRELYVFGPEGIRLLDALREYCRVLHPDASVGMMPIPVMRVIDRLFMQRRLDRTLRLMAMLQRYGERGDPSEANRLLGAPRTTLAAWLRQAASAAPGSH
jgi:NADH dehydrogenase